VKLLESGKIQVDLGGHFRRRTDARMIDFLSLTMRMEIDWNEFPNLLEIANTDKPALKNPVTIPGSCLFECYECGEPVELAYDGKRVYCTNPCKYPDGHPAYEWELNIPSGKMVVGNDFRDKFDIVGDYDVNKTIGCLQTTMKYAEVGMSHAFVGNTCPGVYKIDLEHFVVGIQTIKERNPVPRSRRVGGICTDLWWYSIVDYDQFVNAYGEKPNKKNWIDVVTCRPGVYRFRHQYHLARNDDMSREQTSNDHVYTYIDWVRDPDPVVDFKAKQLEKNITAGQMMANHLDNWPTLYSKTEEGMKRVATNTLFGSAGHHHYHPNGWICGDPDITNDAPSVDIPIFKGEMPFDDISKWSWLCQAAGVGEPLSSLDATNAFLNPSFVEMAFNVCQGYIRYGMVKQEHRKKDDEEREKNCVKWCKKVIKGLAKKYPDQIPEYCKDLI